jgi:hypothetical protein
MLDDEVEPVAVNDEQAAAVGGHMDRLGGHLDPAEM